jgi:hypothetical protein
VNGFQVFWTFLDAFLVGWPMLVACYLVAIFAIAVGIGLFIEVGQTPDPDEGGRVSRVAGEERDDYSEWG